MNQTDFQLNAIKKAYDQTVKMYQEGIDPFDLIPEEFYNSREFKRFITNLDDHCCSRAPENLEFLKPTKGQKIIDVGSCANLASYRLDKWKSLYFGIDISPKLIESMNKFVKKNKINIGGLFVADMANMPFDDGNFDLGMAIGVLEYFSTDYIRKALKEFGRVLKKDARAVVDIPNSEHPDVLVMLQAEMYLGRQNAIISEEFFEKELLKYFNIISVEDEYVMKKYFLIKK